MELQPLFAPRSVAVIGASRTPGKIGHTLLKNLKESGFGGPVYPINPHAPDIEGLKCYADLSGVPGPVDLAAVSLPADLVVPAAEACGRAGVKALVIITAGFKEVGREGLAREKQLIDVCHRYGMTALGPNCLGLVDTHTPLNVCFAPTAPLQGDIAFISQSGAFCVAILDWSAKKGIGFSKFVSLGNKALISETDCIAEAARDPHTRVILCYLEDITEGRRFLEVAREVSPSRPIVVLKAGVSEAGAVAASSHTGALAGSDRAYDVAFRQCGVLRARTMDELFDLAVALATQPLPGGDALAVVTNSGGPGIIATDAIEARGLKMARFRPETLARLRSALPPEASLYNPVDLIASATAERYQRVVEAVLDDPEVSGVLVLLTPLSEELASDTAERLVAVRRAGPEKPVLAAFMGGATVVKASTRLFSRGIPAFSFPEPAVAAMAGLARMRRLREHLARPADAPDAGPVDREAVARVLAGVRRDRRVALLGSEAAEAALAYGIPAVRSVLARSPEQAVAAAEEMGYPVVLKVASPRILHKTDVGGVRLGLDRREAVEQAFIEILEGVERYFPHLIVHGVEVQSMLPEGLELICGMTRDVRFGPLLAFGLGGIYVNLLQDASFRLAFSLGRKDIEAMVSETRASVLLRGFRGHKGGDVAAVIGVLARLARLAEDFPEVAEMEINPLFAYERGVKALDVKMTIS